MMDRNSVNSRLKSIDLMLLSLAVQNGEMTKDQAVDAWTLKWWGEVLPKENEKGNEDGK